MKPLQGMKVIELGTYVAAPTCARILAEWGADVIKVESLKGEVYRAMGHAQHCPITEDANPTFDIHNSNKRFLALNLRSADGMEILHKLLAEADVFVTNTRAEALKAMHISYEDLHEKYPRLVYAHALGYGDKGPEASRPGFDMTAFFCRSGILADFAPAGGDPCNSVTGMGDSSVALALAGGICAALLERTQTGEGRMVNVSLLQIACYLLQSPVLSAYYGKVTPRTRFDPPQANSNTYKCKDGEWFYLAATDYRKHFAKVLTEVVGRPDLITDERFADQASYVRNREALIRIYDDVFITKTYAEWDEILNKADIAHERLSHFKDIPTDPMVVANHYLDEHHYKDGTTAVLTKAPVHFSGIDYENEHFVTSRKQGSDNDEILKELGYTGGRIAEMRSAGAVL